MGIGAVGTVRGDGGPSTGLPAQTCKIFAGVALWGVGQLGLYGVAVLPVLARLPRRVKYLLAWRCGDWGSWDCTG